MIDFQCITPGGICIVGPQSPVQGRPAGDIVDSTGAVVGQVWLPFNGRVEVNIASGAFVWTSKTQDVDGSGFCDGADFDLWMQWWNVGCGCADYLGTNFVSGDSFDAFMYDFYHGDNCVPQSP